MKNKNLVWGVLVAALVIIIIFAMRPSSTPQEPASGLPPAPTVSTSTAPFPPVPKPVNTAPTVKNALEVTNQKPGTKMTVAVANLEKAGFVAIRAVAHDGAKEIPGSVVAYSPILTRGAHKNVVINIPLSPAGIYYATLYADTDSNKILNTGSDQPLKDAQGAMFAVRFEANVPVSFGQSYTITMKGGMFTPNAITIPKGSPVIFTNDDIISHAIYSAAFGGEHVLSLGASYILDTNKLSTGKYSYRDNYNTANTGTITIVE